MELVLGIMIGVVIGGFIGMGFMCVFQFKKQDEETTEQDIIAEVKSCAEYVKDYCDWQGRSCEGCVLFNTEIKECKVAGIPKDWGAIE